MQSSAKFSLSQQRTTNQRLNFDFFSKYLRIVSNLTVYFSTNFKANFIQNENLEIVEMLLFEKVEKPW
jgi:hypothetical protein